MFRLDFQRPFDILLNFKALQNEADGKKENKRRGSSGKIPERPVLSGTPERSSNLLYAGINQLC